jgi:fermentation-respiration switch protein FrsA (DUF1100 family)
LWRGLSLYLVVILVLMLFENYLIFPAPKYPAGRWQPTGIQVEDIYFASRDGTRLHGWYVDHPQPVAHVLYFHGNGEHLGYLDFLLEEFHRRGLAVFAFDYRGYGRSEGSPDESGIVADGEAALQWLTKRLDIPPERIVLWGRSIGGAVAVNLAVAHGTRALVLESSFSSLTDVAARLYWWAPVRWLLRSRFDSESKIRTYQGPLLQSHGTDDGIVPVDLAQRLFDACPSNQKEFYSIRGGDHNDPPPDEYLDAILTFLNHCCWLG